MAVGTNDPIRERLVAAARDQFRLIRQDAGYFTTVTVVAPSERDPFVDEFFAGQAVLAVMDTDERDAGPTHGDLVDSQNRELTLVVQGMLCATDRDTGGLIDDRAARLLLADIQRATYAGDFGGLAVIQSLGANRKELIVPDEETGPIWAVEQDLLVFYRFRYDDPREP